MKLTIEDFEKGRAWMREQAPTFADKLAPIYEAGKHFWERGEYPNPERYIPNRDQILKFLLREIDAMKYHEDGPYQRCGGIEMFIVRDGWASYEACIKYFVSEHLFDSCSNPDVEEIEPKDASAKGEK